MLAMKTQIILAMFLNASMECRLQNIAQSIWENEYEKKKSVRYSVCHYDGSFFDDGNYVYIYGVCFTIDMKWLCVRMKFATHKT